MGNFRRAWFLGFYLAVTMSTALVGCGGDNNAPVVLPDPLLFNNFQAASVVIGQPDFTSNTPNQGGTTAANTVASPYGNPTVNNGTLYLPDYGNNRVLGFNSIPSANNANADFALGQSDLTSNTAATSQSGLNGPQSVSVTDGKFFATEFNNSRVLIYDPVPTVAPGIASNVIGQPDFTSSTPAATKSGLNNPEASFAVGNKIIVADSNNNRVLIWNRIPTVSLGSGADIVLGQSNFDNTKENDDDQDGVAESAPTARTMFYPAGVWSDGTRLVVVDNSNSRVLIWTRFPTQHFQPADVVLGQIDFTNNRPNDTNQDGTEDALPTARTLSYPYNGVFALNGQLFVTDTGNHRVLIWNTFPTTNFAAADIVLGQSDFVHKTENDDNQDGSADATPSERTMLLPSGLHVEGTQLFVTDESNNRYLVFDAL